MGEIKDPRYSRRIDVHRWSDHPEVKGLTDKVWTEAGLDGLVKVPGPKPKRPFIEQLRVLLLDLYVAWLEDPDLSIGVSMDYDAWKVGSRYNALHISKKVLVIIPALHDADLIDLSKGSYSGPNAKTNRTTRIRASEALRKWFVAARFGREDIGRAICEEIIILKDKDEGRNARRSEYKDTAHTNRMRDELRAYNELIASAFIDMRQLDEPVLQIRDDNGITRSIRLDADACRTHRVFSRGSWDLNGRFYGGWWQRINSTLRAQICIDNQPTIEVDYQGLHVAMLYAQAGQPMTLDPYLISVKGFPDHSPEQLRSLTKQLVLKAINAKDKRSAYQAFRTGLPEGDPAKRLQDTDLDRITAAFLNRNPPLEKALFSDQGIRLMRLDAAITERIHNHFTGKGIPVLSVHDSYIIDVEYVDELRRVMADASQAVVGMPLRCGVDLPGYGEFDDVPDGEIMLHLGKLTWDVYDREQGMCKGYLARMHAYEKRTGKNIYPI